MKKLLCIMLSVLMLTGVLSGCASSEERLMKEMSENPETVVARIGNQDIYAYEIMSLMRLGATKEEALENLNMMKVFALKVDEFGLSLSEEEITATKDQLMQQKEQDVEYFDMMLEAYGVTEEQFTEISLLQQLQSVIGKKIEEDGLLKTPTDDEILQYYNDNFLMSEHILFSTVDENRQPIDDAALIDEKAMKAKEVSDKIKNGASFDEFVSLTEEPTRDEDGMLFLNTANFDVNDVALSYFQQMGVATMVTEFEEGTAALKVGEVSEPVKSDFGFHIIRRLALPTEGEEFEQTKQSISMVLDNANYTKLIEGWAAEYEKTTEEKYFNALTVTPYTEDEDLMNRLQTWEMAQQQAQSEVTEQAGAAEETTEAAE